MQTRDGHGNTQDDDIQTGVGTLFRSAVRDLRGYLRLRLGNSSDAEDVAQEAFLRIWQNGNQAGDLRNPRSFLFNVAHNLATDRLRERVRHAGFAADPAFEARTAAPDAQPTPEQEVAGRQELARVTAAIEALPPNCRRAFLLRLDGLTHKAIAVAMGVSSSMVEKHLARALRELDAARNQDAASSSGGGGDGETTRPGGPIAESAPSNVVSSESVLQHRQRRLGA